MPSANFRALAIGLAKADLDFDTLTAKTLLVSSVPSEANLDGWMTRSQVTNEVTGAGYTSGGVAQAFTLDAFDNVNDRQPITYADNPAAWPTVTVSAVGCIIYKDTGNPATDTLLHYVDYGGTQAVTNGPFGLNFNTPFYINA